MATSLNMPRWLTPWARLARGQQPGAQLTLICRQLGMPIVGILVFLMLWQTAASRIDTSLGQFPGPAQVWEQAGSLHQEHVRERQREQDFIARQQARIAERQAVDPDFSGRIRPYTGSPTYYDQIRTSVVTVMSGFLLASLIAIPLGIAIGLSANLFAAVNPLIQLLRPVSPLAWLPLVTIVVSAVYVSSDPMFSRSFVVSMITVTLCCLWPTVLNTALGVTSVSSDLLNVSRVLRLNALTHIRRIVLPGAVPMIFAGLRLSLGIAWMVLIAAEMLAQNPGLGKFVWDEFQNGSSQSLSRILVAVVTIGIIGYLLDQSMMTLQRAVSWDKHSTDR